MYAIRSYYDTVEHREERRVVQIMEVDFTTFVCLNDITRQQILFCVMFSDNTREQIALRWNDFTVFVRVFVQQFCVGLLNQIV